ncbi:MAG TPA: hypothetical protein VG694_02285 [Candidatus Paceibacterota bacterium]|nr:hypothetical protein [Candidatus Paceibacterota bacterium]
MNFWDKLKQKIWHRLYRVFPSWQRNLLKAGLIRHRRGRQRYHIGWLAPGRTLEELKSHLHKEWGFGNHFVAWEDEGQVLSWRKLPDFRHQYHLRVFHDGEIRGHFEYTPEAHPIDHLLEIGERAANEEFLRYLGEFRVAEEYISKLEPDPNAFDPDSQFTFAHAQALQANLKS